MTDPNAAERDYWTSESGRKWVAHQAEMDLVLQAVNDRLIGIARPAPGERVVDIGGGTGALTRQVVEHVRPGGHVTMVDISGTLLDRARALLHAPDVDYVLADAQTHEFEPDAADLVISRFGVMFFADPVAAFANIRTALRPGGRLVFACWAALDRNPWFRIPRDIAIARLGAPAPADPHAPGPLAFADAGRVAGILRDAGFGAVEGGPQDLALRHPGGPEGAAALAGSIGPAVRILNERGGTAEDAAAIGAALAVAFRDFATGDGFEVPACLNFFTASA